MSPFNCTSNVHSVVRSSSASHKQPSNMSDNEQEEASVGARIAVLEVTSVWDSRRTFAPYLCAVHVFNHENLTLQW